MVSFGIPQGRQEDGGTGCWHKQQANNLSNPPTPALALLAFPCQVTNASSPPTSHHHLFYYNLTTTNNRTLKRPLPSAPQSDGGEPEEAGVRSRADEPP